MRWFVAVGATVFCDVGGAGGNSTVAAVGVDVSTTGIVVVSGTGKVVGPGIGVAGTPTPGLAGSRADVLVEGSATVVAVELSDCDDRSGSGDGSRRPVGSEPAVRASSPVVRTSAP
jgi:hypothetical protein